MTDQTHQHDTPEQQAYWEGRAEAADHIEALTAQVAVSREALVKAREDIARFPKSMGYDITSLRHIDEALSRTPAQSRAVSLRFHHDPNGTGWPKLGEKCLIRINGVLQHEVFEFDREDDGAGISTAFWHREDCEECPLFDPENDEWLPLSEIEQSARASAQSRAEIEARALERFADRTCDAAMELELREEAARIRAGGEE